MSDALLGVLVGGLIGIVGTLFTIRYQHKQWKITYKIAYLEKRKQNLSVLFEEFSITYLRYFSSEDFNEKKLGELFVP